MAKRKSELERRVDEAWAKERKKRLADAKKAADQLGVDVGTNCEKPLTAEEHEAIEKAVAAIEAERMAGTWAGIERQLKALQGASGQVAELLEKATERNLDTAIASAKIAIGDRDKYWLRFFSYLKLRYFTDDKEILARGKQTRQEVLEELEAEFGVDQRGISRDFERHIEAPRRGREMKEMLKDVMGLDEEEYDEMIEGARWRKARD